VKDELFEAMLTAHEAGLGTFPLGANKRPGVKSWKEFMERLAGLDELAGWRASDHSGYAVVMGGAERALAIDLEAGFVMDRARMQAFVQRLRDEELEGEWSTWVSGMSATTPSGGMHVVIRLLDGIEMPRSEKLAFADGKVIAETRGQGSYIVGWGSNGDCHPTGGQWMRYSGGYGMSAFVEPATWLAVKAILVEFDEAPLAPVDHGGQPAAGSMSSTGGVSLAQIELSSPSWIDQVDLPVLAEVLRELDWWSPDGIWWWRPGKDHREQHSARINENGRLYLWSTSTPLISSDQAGGRTYDVVDVIAAYEHIDRMTVLRRYKPTSPGREAPSQPPSGLVLPEEFWSERPLFEHILTAARARRVSPDAVLGMLLGYYAATLPWNFRLPQDGTLDYLAVIVGNAGAGKTSAKRTALALLPEEAFALPEINLTPPAPVSGEGMMEAYILREKGQQIGLRYRGNAFYTDEGGAFFEVAGRKGNQVIQTLKSACFGEMTGTLTATQDRHRVLPTQGVRMATMIGIQVDPASQFLNDEHANGGLPQRCLWFWAHRERSASWNQSGVEAPEWPGRLDLPLYPHHNWGGGSEPTITHDLEVCSEVWAIISAERDSESFDEGLSPLDTHRAHSTEKVAMILALADRRTTLELSDWNLASQIWQSGRRIRTQISARKQETFGSRSVALGQADAVRAEAARLHRVDLAAAALGRRVWRSDEPVIYDQAKNSVRQYDAGPFSVIRDRAVDLGYVVFHKGEGLRAGGTRPPKGRG
jgi:hypothetical protein